jgi:aldehyde:ferredoxin oxidoreductase
MINGYMGKILRVDLNSGRIETEELEENFCRQFIGGYGFGASLLFDRMKPGIDPLGPENLLGFFTGVLSGTPALSSTRYTVVGKSPLTGTWGDSNSGGYFGPYLKFAGFDGVLFAGISPGPVYLLIDNGKAELRGAAFLWGKDTFQTEDILRAELGEDTQVACIGPSGEAMSLIAAIMNNKGRAAGRSGLGAVMGSKRLKAIAVRGQLKVPMADEAGVLALRKKLISEFTGPIEAFRNFGTTAFVIAHGEAGDSPVKNWEGTAIRDFPDIEPLGANHLVERRLKKYTCYQCPIACGGVMKKGTGKYQYEAGSHRPEYETLSMFGSNCLNKDLDSIIMINDICNRAGLDTISTGACVAFALECYERGLVMAADTGGIELTWGNDQAIVAMVRKIARREDLGVLLADGVKRAAEKIRRDSEQFAIHIRGQELPAHDPKYAIELGTTYKLDATPGRHSQGSEGRQAPGLIPDYDPRSFAGRGEIHKKGANFVHIINCSGMCSFMYGVLPSVQAIPDFIKAITGWQVTTEELLVTGERIANIRQAFNIREGLNPLEFKVPDRLIGKPPKTVGPTAGVVVDEATLYREYLTAMDWDLKTAKPSRQKLLELGLAGVARELWGK